MRTIVSVALDNETVAGLDRIAASDGRSRSSMLRRLLSEGVRHRESEGVRHLTSRPRRAAKVAK